MIGCSRIITIMCGHPDAGLSINAIIFGRPDVDLSISTIIYGHPDVDLSVNARDYIPFSYKILRITSLFK